MYCAKSDWFIQCKLDRYFIRENRSKDALNHREFYEIVIQA